MMILFSLYFILLITIFKVDNLTVTSLPLNLHHQHTNKVNYVCLNKKPLLIDPISKPPLLALLTMAILPIIQLIH